MKTIHLWILLSFIGGFSATTCNFDVSLHQELRNLGFHRNITYKVTLRDTYGDSQQYEKCFISLDQTLPAGVFAAPDELDDLRRMNKLVAILRSNVNVEQPAEDAQPTSVFIISQVNGGEANLWLPVHARYHRAVKGGGSYHNKIEPPRVFIRCPQVALAHCTPKTSLVSFRCSDAGREMCIWKEIYASVRSNPIAFFAVPIGDLNHNNIVVPGTVGTMVVFSLYLLKSLHDYKLALLKK